MLHFRIMNDFRIRHLKLGPKWGSRTMIWSTASTTWLKNSKSQHDWWYMWGRLFPFLCSIKSYRSLIELWKKSVIVRLFYLNNSSLFLCTQNLWPLIVNHFNVTTIDYILTRSEAFKILNIDSNDVIFPLRMLSSGSDRERVHSYHYHQWP